MPSPRPAAALALAAATAAACAADGPTTRGADYPSEATSVSEAIGVDELRAQIAWLADDAREGRGIYTDGLDQAADFIAAQFEQLGLEPLDGGGFGGTYFQEFDLPGGREFDPDGTSLSAGDLTGTAGEDFTPLGWSEAGEFAGKLAFVGYGVADGPGGYDDFAGVDVTGRVVLMMRYEPFDDAGDSRFAEGDAEFSRAARLYVKAQAAAEAGAAAVLIVNPPEHSRAPAIELMGFGGGRTRADVPAFHVTGGAADALLDAAGLPPLIELQEQIDATGEPASQLGDGPEVTGGFASSERTITVRNVAAMLPGETDEYVVIGGHYDHVGRGEYGSRAGGNEIHNGADDNASGTAAILEVAEAMAVAAERGDKPKRGVIFALFTAEELGLLGSRHMVANPPVPAGQMVGMVNLDMVGRVRDETLYVGGQQTGASLEGMVAVLDAGSPLRMQDMGRGFDDRSDHASFINAGIPAVFFFSGLHPQYHGPDDDVELVNYDGLAEVARAAGQMLVAMAEAPRESLAFTGQPRNAAGDRPRLGISIGVEDGGGVGIASMLDDSPAARAGMQAGDVLIELGGEEVTDLGSLREVLGAIDVGSPVPAVVERDGERVELSVDFGDGSDEEEDQPSTRPS